VKQRTDRIAELEKTLAPPKAPKVKVPKTPKAAAPGTGPTKLSGKQRTARIAHLEEALGQTKHPVPKASPAQVTGKQPKTNVDFKQPKTPDVPKAAPKPVELTAPTTVSESQKRRADKKFYTARDRKYRAQQAKPDPKIPVTSVEDVTAKRAQAEADVVKAKQNTARILEIETTLKEGEYSKSPSTTINVHKKSAAQLFGTTEKEISKVARRIDPVKPSLEGAAKFAEQIKHAPPDVKAIHARMAEIEADLAKVDAPKPIRTGAKPITDIKAAIAKHKASAGERLPLPKPFARTKPSEARTEQAGAEVKTKPATPPKATKAEATKVTPPKTEAQRTAKSQEAYSARHPAKPLTSPAIGAHVKATIKGGALLAGIFSVLEAGEAAAKEHRPGKRAEVALKQAKSTAGATIKGIAGYTGAAAVTAAAFGKVASGAVFKTALPAYLTYKVGKEFTIPTLKKLGKQVEGAYTSKREAKQEKAASEKKYGTVFAATRTRHAKEALKVAERKKKMLMQLTKSKDKKDVRKTFGLRDA